jgi:hypothetical protein
LQSICLHRKLSYNTTVNQILKKMSRSKKVLITGEDEFIAFLKERKKIKIFPIPSESWADNGTKK